MNVHPSLTGQVNVRESKVFPFFFYFLIYNRFANIYFRKSLTKGLNWLKAVLL